jgi:hypothetical protein
VRGCKTEHGSFSVLRFRHWFGRANTLRRRLCRDPALATPQARPLIPPSDDGEVPLVCLGVIAKCFEDRCLGFEGKRSGRAVKW